MNKHSNPNASIIRDIDRQYLENIRHLRHKIVEVQQNQREISHALERIRSRIQVVVAEMQRCQLRTVSYET